LWKEHVSFPYNVIVPDEINVRMELVYSLDCDVYNRERDWISEKKTCCSLSPQNILAFPREVTVNNR
jgi:hypothetical protein